MTNRMGEWREFMKGEPSKEEMYEFEREEALLRLPIKGRMDPEVVPFVEALNDTGFYTMGSCSGHGKKGGFVTLLSKSGAYSLDKDEKEEVRQIARDCNIGNLTIGTEDGWTIVRFGKIRWGKKG